MKVHLIYAFYDILNMSITAGYLVIAILFLRLILKKAPKWIMGVLWGFVALRLIFPASIESALSIIPSERPILYPELSSTIPVIHSGIDTLNSTVNPIIQDNLQSADNVLIFSNIIPIIWLIGIAIMLLYTLFSFIHIKRSVCEAVKLRDNIWVGDNVSTPFILGVIKQKIYLPSNMNEDDMAHVIAHEKAHLKRKDHIIKPLGFLLLSVYWFNPILWLAYILMCRDIELACDEKVLRQASEDIKKAYSNALINCSAPKKIISACPVAFGEVGVKARIKNVLSYKKPAFWVIIAAIIICIVTAVCLLTNPITSVAEQPFGKKNVAPESPFGKEFVVLSGENSQSLSMYYYDSDFTKKYSFSDDGKAFSILYHYNISGNVPNEAMSVFTIKDFTECNINTLDLNFDVSKEFEKPTAEKINFAWRIETEHPDEVYYLYQFYSGEFCIARFIIMENTGEEAFATIEKLHLESESTAIIGGVSGPSATEIFNNSNNNTANAPAK